MDDVWIRIERFLAANQPLMLEGLASGATEEEIATFESTVGYRLPEDVRVSLKRHNGQMADPQRSGEPIGGLLIPFGWELLSLKWMLVEWREHRSISEDFGGDNDIETGNPGVKPYVFHPAWIPIAAEGGNSLCVDLDPDIGGTIGQIIEFNHEQEGPKRIADDYRSWFESLADGFEAGKFPFNERLRLFEV